MSSKVIRIGQISDIHIGEDDNLVQGIDVRANFMTVLKSKSMSDLDLLVLSGDLANEDGEAGAYKFIADTLKDYEVPVCVIPGNHDRLEVMQNYFGLDGKVRGGKCFYRHDVCGRTVFLIDSACGTVSKEQLVWLKEEAAKVDDEGAVLLLVVLQNGVCGAGRREERFADLQMRGVGRGAGVLDAVAVRVDVEDVELEDASGHALRSGDAAEVVEDVVLVDDVQELAVLRERQRARAPERLVDLLVPDAGVLDLREAEEGVGLDVLP